MLHSPMDILLACEEDAKSLVGIVQTTKSVWLQTEYRVTLHGVPIDLTEERLGGRLLQIWWCRGCISCSWKTDIVTGDYVLQITVSRKNFIDISDTLFCGGRSILVIVESHLPTAGVVVQRVTCQEEPGTETSNSRSTSSAQISSTQRSSGGGKVRPDLQWLQRVDRSREERGKSWLLPHPFQQNITPTGAVSPNKQQKQRKG